MVKQAKIALFLLITICAEAKGTEIVAIQAKTQKGQAGDLEYSFVLKAEKEIGPDDLLITHEKKLHLLIYDPALQEFVHEHPGFQNGLWKTKFNLPRNGSYFIWAQGQLKDKTEFNALTRLSIEGGKAENPAPPRLKNIRTSTVDDISVKLSPEKLRAGKMALVKISFTTKENKPAKMEPYLGAFAHVVAVSSDGKEMIHVHPMNGNAPNEGMIHALFPKAGAYRVWVQFIAEGKLLVAPLSVEVR